MARLHSHDVAQNSPCTVWWNYPSIATCREHVNHTELSICAKDFLSQTCDMHCLLTGRSLLDLLPAKLYEQGQLQLPAFFSQLDDLRSLLEMCGVDEATVSDEAEAFLGLMLKVKPWERATAKQLLEHEFLASEETS